jgi:hypothetical protein
MQTLNELGYRRGPRDVRENRDAEMLVLSTYPGVKFPYLYLKHKNRNIYQFLYQETGIGFHKRKP